MSTSDSSSKKGTSPFAILGIGCGILAIGLGIGAFVLIGKGCSMAKEYAAEYQKNPAKATALLVLKSNPDYELVSTDDAKSEVTVKQKSTGETLTLSFDDIAQGKMVMKNSKGQVITMDGSQQGKITINGPSGTTTIGGKADGSTAPPAWVPQYPGATVQSGGLKSEQEDKISGTSVSMTSDPVQKVRDTFETDLKAAGFTVTTTSGGNDIATGTLINATKTGPEQNLTIALSTVGQTTNIVINYNGTK